MNTEQIAHEIERLDVFISNLLYQLFCSPVYKRENICSSINDARIRCLEQRFHLNVKTANLHTSEVQANHLTPGNTEGKKLQPVELQSTHPSIDPIDNFTLEPSFTESKSRGPSEQIGQTIRYFKSLRFIPQPNSFLDQTIALSKAETEFIPYVEKILRDL